MEKIKKSLKYDYNQVVKCYNEKDNIGFFRNVRPMIERLSKFIIYDILEDELDADGIIDGSLLIVKSNDGTFAIENNDRRKPKPQGKVFALLIPKIFSYRHPEMVSIEADQEKKRIYRGIDSCCSELARYYDIASGIAMHTDSNPLNVSIQASAFTSFLLGFLDFLNSYLLISKNSSEYFKQLDTFAGYDSNTVNASREEINSLIKELEVKDAAVMAAKALQLEAEKNRIEAEGRNAELTGQVSCLQAMIDKLRAQIEQMTVPNDIIVNEEDKDEPQIEEQASSSEITLKPKKKIIDILRGPSSAWDIEETSMDDDQLDIIDMNIDHSMLVTGCAGSGKSVIAMHKAEQIANTGASVILIAYTRSLSAYMREGINTNTLPYRFCHHYQWKNKLGMMKADYIIVDEIQDFTEQEIREFMAAAKIAYFFFGDSAQSIYKLYGKQTINIDEISALTGLAPLQLYNNYRLPRPVARITQDYVGVNVDRYQEKVYQNKETALPHLVKLETFEEQVEAISKLVEKYYTDLFDKRDIGILVPTNDMVMKFHEALDNRGIPCEFKYSDESGQDWHYVDTLDFSTSLPKIMTYHSAKGLQFDIVILPMYGGATDEESRKALYVAMTRTLHQLFIFYSMEKISEPLDAVPSRLFIKTL